MRRTAALLEVLGIYLVGGLLKDKLADLLARFQIASVSNPLALLTSHTTNADLLLASRRFLLIWILQYGSYFALILPLNWWFRRRGRKAYGITQAGYSINWLLAAGFAAACLSECPVLILSLVNVVHPLGPMAPWRQAFLDTSWQRWQFWLFAAVFSYAVVPVVEELLFRGYLQRRLAEDWGDGPAILGASSLFVFAHKQYFIPNFYNAGMVLGLTCLALGLGIVFAYTRSLIPPIIAHAIIDVPMTPKYEGALLGLFVLGLLVFFRPGLKAVKQVFNKAPLATCFLLASACALYVISSQHLSVMTELAIVLLVAAIGVEWRMRVDSSAPTPDCHNESGSSQALSTGRRS